VSGGGATVDADLVRHFIVVLAERGHGDAGTVGGPTLAIEQELFKCMDERNACLPFDVRFMSRGSLSTKKLSELARSRVFIVPMSTTESGRISFRPLDSRLFFRPPPSSEDVMVLYAFFAVTDSICSPPDESADN